MVRTQSAFQAINDWKMFRQIALIIFFIVSVKVYAHERTFFLS